MTVLQSQAYLRKPVENLIFCKVVLGNFWLAFVLCLKVLNLKRHVATYMHTISNNKN